MRLAADPFLLARVGAARAEWDERDGTRRLFARDASLWTGGDEARWLDWLDLASARAGAQAGRRLREDAAAAGLSHAVLLGMGGSSLCPEVLARVLGRGGDGLGLDVVDTVDPVRVAAAVDRLDLRRTLVIVASKSGSTLEPNILLDLLLARLAEAVGAAEAPRRVVAITDPGSSLQARAEAAGFRAVVPGVAGIGGRYSALSPFGMVPAALLGADADALLARADEMAERCRRAGAGPNPGVDLGVALGTFAREGRDKMSLLASPRLAPVGAWVEQLVAESTGKLGAGLLPVDGEPALDPARYADDRAFVALRLADDPGAGLDERLAALAAAGHPVVTLDVPSVLSLGALFYQWEIATAVAGAVMGLHPFDQPDVEASKVAARARLESGAAASGASRVVVASGDGLVVEAPESVARDLAERLAPGAGPREAVAAFTGRLRAPDYLAVLLWRAGDPRVVAVAEGLRDRVARERGVAATLGIGPRFLHSTGQLHKGGPATGAFVQVMGPPGADLAVPGRAASFGQVETAQAEGDFDVLASRGRRALLVRMERPDTVI